MAGSPGGGIRHRVLTCASRDPVYVEDTGVEPVLLVHLTSGRTPAPSCAFSDEEAPTLPTGTCIICDGPSPDDPCCSPACLREATRERDANLRAIRRLRGKNGSAALRAELTHRNGELTGALVNGLHRMRPRSNA